MGETYGGNDKGPSLSPKYGNITVQERTLGTPPSRDNKGDSLKAGLKSKSDANVNSNADTKPSSL